MHRIVFFGTECKFADQSLSRLLQEGWDVRAVVFPGTRGAGVPVKRRVVSATVASALPMAGVPGRVGRDSSFANVPTQLTLNDPRHPQAIDSLRALNADLAVVCCYPARLPMTLMTLFPLGGVNVHPSLLPDYRGPEPLFWQFYFGERTMGVTIHRVDSGLDTGPILLQESLNVAVGEPGDDVWRSLGRLGAELLTASIRRLQGPGQAGRSQPQHRGSYYTWPTESDLVIDPAQWRAWRAHHFIRGAVPLGYPPTLPDRGARILDSRYSPGGAHERSSADLKAVRFTDELLLLRIR
jgi:methionyl-tRNA formyltransferase